MSRLKARVSGSVAWKASALLPQRQRRKLFLLVAVQVFLGSLDLISVALVGLLGSLAIANLQSRPIGPSGTIGRVVDLFQLSGQSMTVQIAVIGVITSALFILRTAASIYLIRRALHFLGVRAADASTALVQRLLAQPITFVQSRSTQELIYAVNNSMTALLVGVLGSVVTLAGDVAVLCVVGMLLFVASPVVALAASLMLLVLVVILNTTTTSRSRRLGEELSVFSVVASNVLAEAIATFRDMCVRSAQAHYLDTFGRSRIEAGKVQAEMQFLPNVSKYVLESAVILGALVIGALEFLLQDAQHAVGVLALFLAAGSRLAPAIIRLQQGAINVRLSAGQAQYALNLQAALPLPSREFGETQSIRVDHQGFIPTIEVRDATYTYPGSQEPALRDASLMVPEGALVALVGPSGAGKSTLADLLIGILQCASGSVRVSDVSPEEAILRWPGAIGYVPQDVWITDGTLKQNVALGYREDEVPEHLVWKALESAGLADTVRALPEGLRSNVGERGSRLSGGQRQRLGIARALLTQPRMLVLDEATSALDAMSEHVVTEAIRSLHGMVTVVVIAHRLATVRHADQVIYLERGRLVTSGTFAEVVSTVPNFARQAELLGLA